nr:MAG TPA: hypothetical protein [Caudoviricetes sp.]
MCTLNSLNFMRTFRILLMASPFEIYIFTIDGHGGLCSLS